MKKLLIKSIALGVVVLCSFANSFAVEEKYCPAKGGIIIQGGSPWFVCPLQAADQNCMYLCSTGN